MGNDKLKHTYQKYLSKKSKSSSKKEQVEFRVIEDKPDLKKLEWIAAEGTRKGFKRAKKVSSEIIIVQQGKLIRKRSGKPNQVISQSKERTVEIGKKISL